MNARTDDVGGALRAGLARLLLLEGLLDEVARLKRYDPNVARGGRGYNRTLNVPVELLERIDEALGRA